jgi:hypothetical protein
MANVHGLGEYSNNNPGNNNQNNNYGGFNQQPQFQGQPRANDAFQS